MARGTPFWQARQSFTGPAGARAITAQPAKDWRRPYADSLKETTTKRPEIRLFLQIVRNSHKTRGAAFAISFDGVNGRRERRLRSLAPRVRRMTAGIEGRDESSRNEGDR